SCAPSDPLDDPGHGSTLRLASRFKIARGYSYWLVFLREQGWLDETAAPGDRLSDARSAAWFRSLKARGNRPGTIISRFAELSLAIRVLSPDADRRCVLQPNGASVRRRLDDDRRGFLIPDARVLYREGYRLMDSADPTRRDRWRTQLLQYRDGLFFAIQAARARRLGTVAQTTISDNLRRMDDRYRLDYAPEQIKTNRVDRVPLPKRLTPYIDRYLTEIRPQLLRGQTHDAFWVGTLGEPLAESGIEKLVRVRSRRLLGVPIGTHRFRHAIGTTAPAVNRAQPRLGSTVLNISETVARAHYNRANADLATELFHQDMLERTEDANSRERLSKVKQSTA
ncbi:integrase, partial [Acidiphilium sp.]|uniref:integrase n=1 Tax=Acidiphilium sp. TaxID=527 RepID=UPI003D04E103